MTLIIPLSRVRTERTVKNKRETGMTLIIPLSRVGPERTVKNNRETGIR